MKGIEAHPERCTGCLICQLMCSFTFEGRFNPSRARIKIDRADGSCRISFSRECTLCGRCAEHCLYGALEVRGEG